MTPTAVSGEVVRLKGRRLNNVPDIESATIGGQQCQLYNESLDEPFANDYYYLECLLPEGRLSSGTHNISLTSSYSGGGDALFLPPAWHVNHRTGRMGMIDVAAVTDSVEPSAGSLAGGTEVVLRGQAYSGEEGALEVRVGGAACVVTSYSDDEIRCKLAYRPDALTKHAQTVDDSRKVYAKAALFQRGHGVSGSSSYATVKAEGREAFVEGEMTVDFWLKAVCIHCGVVSYVMGDGDIPLQIRIW
jgi:hypothetical protein